MLKSNWTRDVSIPTVKRPSSGDEYQDAMDALARIGQPEEGPYMDIRQILSDNAIKEMHAEMDLAILKSMHIAALGDN